MHGAIEECEPDYGKHAEKEYVFVDVVENIVPHLVTHYGLDLLGSAAIQKIVIQHDAFRA